uniref:Uncharacterized protein n=1 Tax=Tetranychus urticae TaxID=32264 RepID=T1JT09_TETUR
MEAEDYNSLTVNKAMNTGLLKIDKTMGKIRTYQDVLMQHENALKFYHNITYRLFNAVISMFFYWTNMGICEGNGFHMVVTAQFKVVPVFGDYDHLQLTLKGFNVAQDAEKTLKVFIKQRFVLGNTYTCYKSSNGSTDTKYAIGTYSLTTGSSSYEEGVLSCSWTLMINHGNWPKRVDLFKDSLQSITLYDDLAEILVAQDTSLFGSYHAQYLECCNVHGNDQFLLTFDQTEKQIHYQLYHWKDNVNRVTVTLARKDGSQLEFSCYLNWNILDAHITNGTKLMYIGSQMIEPAVIRGEICSWATPFILGDSRISIDASTSVFDLQFAIDSLKVYTEKDVTLKNSKTQSVNGVTEKFDN